MLGDREPRIDVDGVGGGLAHLRTVLGSALHDDLLDLVRQTDAGVVGGYRAEQIAARSLVEPVLALLVATGSDEALAAARAQLDSADATRSVRALGQLLHLDAVDADALVEMTFRRWEASPKLVDRWLRAQSGARRSDTIARVARLAAGPLYDRSDRSRVMAVWFPFATRNRTVFHDRSGAGYRLFTDELIELMPVNAGLAVRLVGDLLQFQRFDDDRRVLLRAELSRMAAADGMPGFAVGIIEQLLAQP
jgi:aminopeptidase N